MKQLITSEKIKKLELKKSMLNFKIFSLMKKQLFSLVILLALVIVGGNAFGQANDGTTPGNVRYIIQGSTATFTVTTSAESSFHWDVLEAAFTDANIGVPATAAMETAGEGKSDFVSGENTNSTAIKFFNTPATGNIFAVQCTETDIDNSCTTLRRYYVTVFDFDVDVALLDRNHSIASANYDAAEAAFCNSWSGLVVENGHDQTELQNMHADYIVSPDQDSLKYTTTYFMVTIALDGAPTGVGLDDYLWRFQYSMPNASNESIYEIAAITTGATFSGGAGTNVIATATTDLTLASWADNTFTGNNAVYIAASTTNQYIFRVRTHNLMGQDPPMIYDIQIDQVQLRSTTSAAAAGVYQSGEKLHADIIADNTLVGRTALDDGITGTRTIQQSPATTTITITE